MARWLRSQRSAEGLWLCIGFGPEGTQTATIPSALLERGFMLAVSYQQSRLQFGWINCGAVYITAIPTPIERDLVLAVDCEPLRARPLIFWCAVSW